MNADTPVVPIKSPCVNICCLDDNDICLGCYRSVDEIKAWSASSHTQRQDIMRKVAQREKDSGRLMR